MLHRCFNQALMVVNALGVSLSHFPAQLSRAGRPACCQLVLLVAGTSITSWQFGAAHARAERETDRAAPTGSGTRARQKKPTGGDGAAHDCLPMRRPSGANGSCC